MNDFLKRAGEYYANCLMQGYTYPPDLRTTEIEQFLSRMPNSADYDMAEFFFATNGIGYPFNNGKSVLSHAMHRHLPAILEMVIIVHLQIKMYYE